MTNTVSPTAHTRPTTVTASFYLWLVTVILGIISAVVLFVLSGSAEVAGATSTSTGVGTAVYLTGAIIAIIIAVIELIIVFKMHAGRNWARIVLTVLAVLQVISAFTGSKDQGWAGWAGLVAVVIATILMFLPTSNPYFRKTGTTTTGI